MVRSVSTLTREDYFEEALRLLAEGGARAVTIAALCERLAVTKGSFYHHFESGPAFLRDTLRYWERTYAKRLAAAAAEVADPEARVHVLADMASNLHHEAETAIRALARSDTFAEEVQRRVDDERMEAVAATLRELGFSADDAERYAAMSLALLVGAQHLGADRRSVADVLRAPIDLLSGALTAQLPTG